MTESITPELFAHLVDLAALELEPNESEYLRKQLNLQLNVIRELEATPINDKLPITSHGVLYSAEISPPLREDILHIYQDPHKILAQVPDCEDGYIIVPGIPHEELD